MGENGTINMGMITAEGLQLIIRSLYTQARVERYTNAKSLAARFERLLKELQDNA